MRLNFRYLLIFSISFFVSNISFANSDTTKAVIFIHSDIGNDSNAMFYIGCGNYKTLYDSIKPDINGNCKFVVTVKMFDRWCYIGQKSSIPNKSIGFNFILSPNDTVKLDFTKKTLEEFMEFVPNQGISDKIFRTGSERLNKEKEKIFEKLRDNPAFNFNSEIVNFAFPYIDSIIDIDPFVGLELAQLHHQSMFMNYDYSMPYIESFHNKLDKIVAEDSLFNFNPTMVWLNKQLRLNKIAPPFALKNMDKQVITLEKYKEKYLLIDFWASWCGPCIEKGQELMKVYPKYKQHNFEVLGISSDFIKDDWTNAVKRDKFGWEQVWIGTDEKTKKEMFDNYRHTSIPLTILLAPGGRVLKINPTLKEIEDEIMKP
jgi:thiol-disulfide isomerase/thioredoxin